MKCIFCGKEAVGEIAVYKEGIFSIFFAPNFMFVCKDHWDEYVYNKSTSEKRF